MRRLRFPVCAATLGFAAGIGLAPALAQEGRSGPRIEDIQISQAPPEAGGGVSILVKLSEQPKSAAASQVGGALVLDIDGLLLPTLAFDPAGNAMVRHVAVTPSAGAAPGSKIRFEGAAFSGASTTIYRDAVLIEAKLADANLPAGASLMAAATPAKSAAAKLPLPVKIPPPPLAIAKAIAPVPVTPSALAPLVAPSASEHAPPVRPDAVKTNALESHAQVQPPAPVPVVAVPVVAVPVVAVPISLVPVAASAAKASMPASPTPPSAPVKALASLATIAKLDAKSCAGAEAELAKDAWALPALGDRALCLIDQQKYPEAKNRLDQLAAFSPEDWRVDLGRAALASHQGDASQAEIGYRNAAQLAPDEPTRSAIMQMMSNLMGPVIN